MEDKKNIIIIKGNIADTDKNARLRIYADSYLIFDDDEKVGTVKGVYDKIPDCYKDIEVTDYGDSLIIPGFCDIHTHAPQYMFRGMGFDLKLLEWLNTYTYPEESKYADLEYADKAYSIFADDLKNSPTTRACIFATIHKDATLLLMDKLEASGLRTMVGKVNMDRNAQKSLSEESAEKAYEDTLSWVEESFKRYKKTTPILTPRFVPACSDELLQKVAEIKERFDLPLQTHLSENEDEIEWVKKLRPDSRYYLDAYDKSGLLNKNKRPVIMAHCVYSGSEETNLLKERGITVCHCPSSNMNLSSGIAPVRRYLEKGINVGMGTDVAAGTSLNMFREISDAIKASKMRSVAMSDGELPLTACECFYIATRGGGKVFGKTGAFEKDFDADIIVVDDSRISTADRYDIGARIERMFYFYDQCIIKGKYVSGRRII